MDFLSEEPRPRWSKRSTFAPLLQSAAAIPTQWCLAPLWPWRAITVLFACAEGSHQPPKSKPSSVRKLTSSCGTPSSQGVTNFRSRGPGALMRRAVLQAARAVKVAPAIGAPSTSPVPICPFALCLLLDSLRLAYGMRPPSIRSHTRFPSEIDDAGGESTDEPTRRRCEYARGAGRDVGGGQIRAARARPR